ncbi:MAG: hypothetical protein LBP55_02440 [Candidatus Adiutrix sp.]|jgi:hypothetical protein|nr:hypothetical protein [Candidatus Adiutrix sp.]
MPTSFNSSKKHMKTMKTVASSTHTGHKSKHTQSPPPSQGKGAIKNLPGPAEEIGAEKAAAETEDLI